MSNHLLDRSESMLLIVDIQERLAPYVCHIDDVIRNATALIGAAGTLETPIVITEQYPRGLGHTEKSIAAAAASYRVPVIEKIHFNAARETIFRKCIEEYARKNVVICGTEAHVCVLQTAFGLIDIGLQPFVVADATSSRTMLDRDIGLSRLRDAGVSVTTTEMVMFEWLERADSPEFTQLLPSIRDLKRRGS